MFSKKINDLCPPDLFAAYRGSGLVGVGAFGDIARHFAADGDGAARRPVACTDAIGCRHAFGSSHAGHAAGDGDGAAIRKVTAPNSGRLLTTCSGNGATCDDDIAAMKFRGITEQGKLS